MQPPTIVDMRVRPPAAGFDGLALYWDKGRIERMTRDLGFESPRSYRNDSLEECLAEMDVAGVRLGVITGRSSGERMGRVENDAIAAVVARHPDRFIGYAGVDIADVAKARIQLRRVIEARQFKGVVIESGCADAPWVTTWNTANASTGSSNATSITIPAAGTGYNYAVDWNNDGKMDQTGLMGP